MTPRAAKLAPGNPCDATTVCRLLAEYAEGADELQRIGVTLYAYGSVDNDPILLGAEHTTIVRAHHDNRQRWFRVEVLEFDPERQPPWERDPAITRTLSRRAAIANRPGRQRFGGAALS